MNTQPHILIVDDQKDICDLLKQFLKSHGYPCSVACDGVQMKRILKQARIDLIVLDVMMPGEDGLSLCRNLRTKHNLPVIMLTAMGDETDRIIGLEMGADDYMAKPFSPRELLARIKAVLRRANSLPQGSELAEQQQLKFEGWQLNTEQRELIDQEGIVTSLSTAEFDLLMAFLEHSKRVLSREQLLDLARGRADHEVFDRSIDTLVSRLRRKLEKNAKKPKLIQTVWGGGYKFTACIDKQ